MIVHEKGGFGVKSEGGKNLGGPYRSKAGAANRLRQVEYFKHRDAKRDAKRGGKRKGKRH